MTLSKIKTRATYFKRLSGNKEVRGILSGHGLSDEHIQEWLKAIAAIPGHWESVDDESAKQTRDRRKKLGNKIKELAKELSADRDAKWFRVYDHKSVFTSPVNIDRPTLDEYLTDISEMLENLQVSDYRPENKISLKSYAIASIFFMIDRYGGRSPNKDTALIASCLLDESIIGNDVSQLSLPRRSKISNNVDPIAEFLSMSVK